MAARSVEDQWAVFGVWWWYARHRQLLELSVVVVALAQLMS